jgi:hypothetical protein
MQQCPLQRRYWSVSGLISDVEFRPSLAPTLLKEAGRASLLCPGTSDINLFRYGKGIIDFDAKVPDGALDLGVAKQELYRPQIACASVDQGGLGAPE